VAGPVYIEQPSPQPPRPAKMMEAMGLRSPARSRAACATASRRAGHLAEGQARPLQLLGCHLQAFLMLGTVAAAAWWSPYDDIQERLDPSPLLDTRACSALKP